jgi:tryptophan synthase alpha chain
MSRIADLFTRLRAGNRRGLIAYITAGDPSPERTVAVIEALERGGADLIELGVPFSDPVADGPVIQLASDRAISQGVNVKRVLEIAAEVRRRSQIPLLLFSYLNPLLRYGFDELARDAVAAGIDGCLITDLSVEEASEYVPKMRHAGLDTVFLAAPTSTDRRLQLVAQYSTGFVYLVSRTGVTGVRDQLSNTVQPLVDSIRKVTDLPLAVGFGISTPEQAAQVGQFADAIVVGSAFVKIIEQTGAGKSLESKLESFANTLKSALETVPA